MRLLDTTQKIMNIRILSWETKGLRCPDMKVDFDQNKKIHFVQMPNGTGKTTIINLIKHTLSNNWENIDVNDFEDEFRDIKKGEFKLSIQSKINNKKNQIVFKVNLDFSDGSFDVKTTSGRQGERDGFKPTEEIEAFITDKHIRTFIFEGDKLGSYFSPKQDIAIDTIDTFSGISKISDLEDRLQNTFKEMKRGAIGNTEDSLQDEVDDLRDQKDQIEMALETAKEKRNKFSPKLEALNLELEQKENKDKNRNTDLEMLDEDISDIKASMNALESKIALQFKNPYNVSKALSETGKTFLDQLEKQKLPGYAREFLHELAEDDKCICGEEITKEKRKNILENSERYLGGDDALIVNRIKSENKDSIEASKTGRKQMQENFDKLKKLNDEYHEKNKERKKLAIQIAKESGLYEKIEKRDKLQTKVQIIDDEIQKLKRIDSETIADVKKKNAKQIFSLFGINNKLIGAEEKLAKKQGYLSEKESLDNFASCLKDAAEDSRETIINEIKTSLNKKIHSTHKDKTFEIEKIDKCLNVKHQKGGGSGAQKVIAVTAFALSVLERSGVSFPLVIDHPVIAIEDESRNEFSQMIVEVCHQAINFVITGEKADFIIDKKTNEMHSFLDNISTAHTIFRTDRNISQPRNMPNKIDLKTENAVITTDKDYFINFSRI